MHILLTKSDKLTRTEANATLMAVRQALVEFGGQVTVQLFSSLKKTGIEEVETVIGPWLVNDVGPDTFPEAPAETSELP